MGRKTTTAGKLFEAGLVLLLFSLFVHWVTSESVSPWNMIMALGMVLLTGVLACKSWTGDRGSRRRLLAVLSALAGGFWVFSVFRYLGLIGWPLARPPDLSGYLRLLYAHFVLSATVLTPVLVVWSKAKPVAGISWGTWRKAGSPCSGLIVLVLSLVGAWIFAFHQVLALNLPFSGPLAGFIAVCLLKAFLTGATEEICYRGLIQPLAVAHFGAPIGIALQACLFTAFHMHLGEAFFPGAGFLAAVTALGLIFGLVTRLTSGIGWASSVHVAIGVVIEWRNLS